MNQCCRLSLEVADHHSGTLPRLVNYHYMHCLCTSNCMHKQLRRCEIPVFCVLETRGFQNEPQNVFYLYRRVIAGWSSVVGDGRAFGRHLIIHNFTSKELVISCILSCPLVLDLDPIKIDLATRKQIFQTEKE